jgi:hypothetical protein
MKIRIVLIAAAMVAIAFILQNALAKGSQKGGTSILHWMEKTQMISSGIESNVAGSITAKQNQQGNANNQRLTISLSDLEGNATYQLLATIGTDTNPVVAADLPADANGNVLINYIKKANGKGNAGGVALPDVLNPISDIRSLEIVNSSTQTVLSADLTSPDALQYLVKRSLTNDGTEPGAAAALRIHATQRMIQFKLLATGLTPSGSYFLAINDALETNVMSDASGKLQFIQLPAGSPDILDIQSLAILNASSNSVLHTTLP